MDQEADIVQYGFFTFLLLQIFRFHQKLHLFCESQFG